MNSPDSPHAIAPCTHNGDSTRPSRPRVLSIAGTDPTGGAGIQADLKSFLAAGAFGMSVVTALVAQNAQGVRSIHTPPTDFLIEQLNAVFDDVDVDAVKVGMLGDIATIREVRGFLEAHPVGHLVVDPVTIASSGDRLLTAEAEEELRDFTHLADVITPNVPELALLTKTQVASSEEEAVAVARDYAALTQAVVIVKMGHLDGPEAGNVAVYPDGRTHRVSSQRIETKNTHGTGCSLSSALTARLAQPEPLDEALEWATSWLHRAIAAADDLQVGHGHGPVDHGIGLVHREV